MLGFGALSEFPLAELGSPPPPVSISLPYVTLSLTAPSAKARPGKNFDGRPVSISFVAQVPAALAGKNFDAPPITLSYSAPTPNIGFGKHIGLPSVSIDYVVSDADVQTGRVLNLANTFTVVTDGFGSLAEGALGEFALGDGGSVSVTFIRPVRVKLTAKKPNLRAGKNFDFSPVQISLTAPVPEADSRTHPIRINAIAS